MSAQSHRSDPRILGRRTLEKDHRILAGLLRPGLAVLDVGCGTGAITRGIARAVAPHGRVVGIDRDEMHVTRAREEHSAFSNLVFTAGDATALHHCGQFDIVTAARTLQWIAEPLRAVLSMKKAAKPGGIIVVLDYSHSRNVWKPEPPAPFRLFYEAFLRWRKANGWDNEMAANLPAMFREAGLTEVSVYEQNEVTERGDADFAERSALWSEVIDNVGAQIALAGFCTHDDVRAAKRYYDPWVNTELIKQTLAMSTVTGHVSSGNGSRNAAPVPGVL